jgi:hypothetical protein
MTLDLSDDEKLALVRVLTHTIEDDRYPPSRSIRSLKAILADPPPVVITKLFPAPRDNDRSRLAVAARRRRNR